MKGSATDIQAELIEEAKEKAKKLDANAIIGMKTAGNGESIFGTDVHYAPGTQFTILVHSPNANSEKRSQTQIKGSVFGFLEDGRELNYKPHLTNRKK